MIFMVLMFLMSTLSVVFTGNHKNNTNIVSVSSWPKQHVNISEVRYIASVQVTYKANQEPKMCTGVFISSEWILTAAQCFDQGNVVKTVIKYGVHDHKAAVNTIEAEKIIKHDRYISHPEVIFNDIALIRISVPDRLKKEIATVEVDHYEWDDYSQRNCLSVGFGSSTHEDSLLHVTEFMARHDYGACGCIRNNYMFVCAKSDVAVDVCVNDFGGPLLCNGLVVGLANSLLHCSETGQDVCDNETYYRYTYLCPHAEWINKYVPSYINRCIVTHSLNKILTSAGAKKTVFPMFVISVFIVISN